jgi:hypothetical protein
VTRPDIDPNGIMICSRKASVIDDSFLAEQIAWLALASFCHVCGEELLVSLMDLSAIENGAVPLCNICGFSIQERLMESCRQMTVIFPQWFFCRNPEEIAKKMENSTQC